MSRYAFFLLLFLMASISYSQTRRALLVGIDVYKPADVQMAETRGGWCNLDGCVNDAKAIEEIIISRFGFDKKNISTVYDQEAKRKRIIEELGKLIEVSQKNDVVFIYYAGHGSQVYNSMSKEESGDMKDESIVPADLLDIRDKELAALFNKLIDKGVVLTLIFDSCHSGSIARGNNLPEAFKTRHINGSAIDARDPSEPPKPEDRGALVLSAAQPEQLAKEAVDDNGNPHGAFTVALIKALNSSSAGEPVEVLFLRLKAIMQANGSNQEPVMGADKSRRRQGLFGNDLTNISGKTVVAILKNNGTENIEIQGGWAIGLNENCQLKKSDGNATLIITKVTGMAKSVAKLTSGSADEVKPGDLFEVSTWSAANSSSLKVWFPPNSYTYPEILKIAQDVSKISDNKSYTWISDPAKTQPDYVIQYFNGKWIASGPENKVIEMGTSPTSEMIVKKIPKNSSIYLQLPPTKELTDKLQIGTGSVNDAIGVAKNSHEAHYILVGKFIGNTINYAWMRPNVTEADTAFLAATPIRTDWVEIKNAGDFQKAADKLTDFTLRLGKINSWLNISSPPDDGSFPFSLALKNTADGSYKTSGAVYNGEQYSLVLTTNKELLKQWTGESRYVYVFIIDINGKSQQIFPSQNTGNEGNKLPGNSYENEEEIPLGKISFTISAPFGVDSYFLVTSDEAVNNFQAFNNEGVVTPNNTRGGSDLDKLLNTVGSGSRGISQNTTPLNWSVQKLLIKSKEKK